MWRPLIMDQKSKTSRFQFKVIDLVEIIPKVRESFPNNKDNIIVSCAVESSNAYIQWTDEDIWFRMDWNCQVIHEASKTILLSRDTLIQISRWGQSTRWISHTAMQRY